MTENDERILDQFRHWLNETREAAAILPDANRTPAQGTGFSFERIVEEFTALRHEVKLQTRSARALEERLEAGLKLLDESAATYRTAAEQSTATATATSDKNSATALAELDDALVRAREQWEKNAERLIGPVESETVERLEALYAGLSWWQRRGTAAYHRQVCQQVEESEAGAWNERDELVRALLSGLGLIQQRLAKTMTKAGVTRIQAVGKPVDPERMIVVEAVETDGPAGQVIEEIRRGYLWQGKVLRPAEVRAIRPRFDEVSETE